MEKELIFIVEEKDEMRRFIGNFLIDDYKVMTFKKDLEVMATLSKGIFPDIILVSIRREHKHKNNWGLQFINDLKISGLFRAIPVIVIVNNQTEETMQKLNELQVDKRLFFPFDPEKLTQSIEEILRDFKSV